MAIIHIGEKKVRNFIWLDCLLMFFNVQRSINHLDFFFSFSPSRSLFFLCIHFALNQVSIRDKSGQFVGISVYCHAPWIDHEIDLFYDMKWNIFLCGNSLFIVTAVNDEIRRKKRCGNFFYNYTKNNFCFILDHLCRLIPMKIRVHQHRWLQLQRIAIMDHHQ